MGSSQSHEAGLQKRKLSPDERRDLRRNVFYNPDEEFVSGIEYAADKYDYLVIFPVYREGKKTEASGEGPEAGELFRWKHAKNLWYQCIPGDDKRKEEAVQQLQAAWEREFVSIETVVSFGKYVELIRNSVVEMLSQKSGLQLKRSRRKGSIYYRLRAPIRLLEQHAVKVGYCLHLKPEVDPGPEFWTEDEVAEENTEYTRDKAEEVLEELFHVGKISPNDLTIFEDETHPKHWSRRIHTLERIADKVPVTNRYPAYTAFQSDPKLRHVFQTYQSVRGRTLFKAKDRLYLTHSILQSHIDFAVLQVRGIVTGVTALHDASRGERVNADMLARRWVTPWREHLDRVGAPCVSDEAMDEGKRISWLLMPFSQPLEDVREYFGEKIALYFAWLGFYAFSLILPAIVGLALQIYQGVAEEGLALDICMVAAAVFICLWSTIYKKCWDRELNVIKLRWGMEGIQESERDRPDFQGDQSGANNGRRRSRVTNRLETYYPPYKRHLKQAASLAVVLVAIGMVCGIIELLMWAWDALAEEGFEYSAIVMAVIFAVVIQVMGSIYDSVAVALNDWENYKTETEYEDALIFKTFTFQFINNYGALIYVAFVKGPIYGCYDNDLMRDYCMTDLQTLMIVIFIVRLIDIGTEIGVPLVKRMMRETDDESMVDDISTSSGGTHSAEESSMSEVTKEEFEAEVHLETYDGTFDDFGAIILQYGYVNMFLLAFPVVPLLALIENLAQMRSDAYKLLRLYRRPDALPAEDVGMWAHVQDAMGYLGVLSNVGILCFTTMLLTDYSDIHKWLIFLAAEQILTAAKVALHILIPDEPEFLAEVRARNKFVVAKHIYGLAGDDPSTGSNLLAIKTVGEIDIDAPSLEGVSKALTTDEANQLEALDKRRRDIDRELNIVKEQLQTAMQTEVYNEKTGVGETKYGLPLGFINIHLMALEDMGDVKPDDCVVVISVRSTRGDPTPPGPPPKHSNPARPASSEAKTSRMEFNQSFQLAPIRTQEAEIIFDVLNRKSERDSKLGTVRVELRELASQETLSFNKPLSQLDKQGKWITKKGQLYFKARFQYSKVVPLRKKIYQLAEQKRLVEREMTLLRVGRLKK